jgi:hypothetical protein
LLFAVLLEHRCSVKANAMRLSRGEYARLKGERSRHQS